MTRERIGSKLTRKIRSLVSKEDVRVQYEALVHPPEEHHDTYELLIDSFKGMGTPESNPEPPRPNRHMDDTDERMKFHLPEDSTIVIGRKRQRTYTDDPEFMTSSAVLYRGQKRDLEYVTRILESAGKVTLSREREI